MHLSDSTPIRRTVKEFFDKFEYNYDFVEEKNFFRTGFTLDNCKVSILLHADDERNFLFCHALLLEDISASEVVGLTEALNIINFETSFTTICFEPEIFRITCHCGINTDGTTLSVDQVHGLIQMCASTLDENALELRNIAAGSTLN